MRDLAACCIEGYTVTDVWWMSIMWVIQCVCRVCVGASRGKGEDPEGTVYHCGVILYPHRLKINHVQLCLEGFTELIQKDIGMQCRLMCSHTRGFQQDEESCWNNTASWQQDPHRHTDTHAYLPPTHLTALKRRLHQSYSCCLHKSSSHLQDKWGSQIGQCILIKSHAPSYHPLLLLCPRTHRLSHSETDLPDS